MNPFLNTAFKAARKAGDMMIRAAKDLGSVRFDSKAFNDFVSDVDRMSETILTDALIEAYPQHKITAEEGGSRGNPRADYEWIIDPLDGTTNYLHGHPQYAVSMALLYKGKIQEALVYAPERNDLYMASRGKGALLNDRRIRVSSRIELNQCLIGTGFPVVDQSRTDTYLAILKDILAKTAGAKVRPRWTCARWPPAVSTPFSSSTSNRGTSPPARLSPKRPARSLPTPKANRAGCKAATSPPPTRKCWRSCCPSSPRTRRPSEKSGGNCRQAKGQRGRLKNQFSDGLKPYRQTASRKQSWPTR